MKILIAGLLLFFALGAFTGTLLNPPQIEYITKEVSVQELKVVKAFANASFAPHAATIRVPAIEENGEGVTTKVTVQALSGTGKTLANIDRILFFVDTQSSINTARDVASNYTGIDLSNIDIIIDIEANASVIEGPSAGGPLTVGIIAALEQKHINPQVMLTGTINADGTIGQVGQVPQKAEAAKNAGATTFLVPQGYPVNTLVGYEKKERCTTENGIEYCTIDYEKKVTDPTRGLDLTIQEVATIEEAVQYLLVE